MVTAALLSRCALGAVALAVDRYLKPLLAGKAARPDRRYLADVLQLLLLAEWSRSRQCHQRRGPGAVGHQRPLASFCRETLEMGVFQGVRAYVEALEWLSWLRSGTDQEGKKCRGG